MVTPITSMLPPVMAPAIHVGGRAMGPDTQTAPGSTWVAAMPV